MKSEETQDALEKTRRRAREDKRDQDRRADNKEQRRHIEAEKKTRRLKRGKREKRESSVSEEKQQIRQRDNDLPTYTRTAVEHESTHANDQTNRKHRKERGDEEKRTTQN